MFGDRSAVAGAARETTATSYTAETYTGARVQRFLFKGVGPGTEREQRVVWPEGR